MSEETKKAAFNDTAEKNYRDGTLYGAGPDGEYAAKRDGELIAEGRKKQQAQQNAPK